MQWMWVGESHFPIKTCKCPLQYDKGAYTLHLDKPLCLVSKRHNQKSQTMKTICGPIGRASITFDHVDYPCVLTDGGVQINSAHLGKLMARGIDTDELYFFESSENRIYVSVDREGPSFFAPSLPTSVVILAVVTFLRDYFHAIHEIGGEVFEVAR